MAARSLILSDPAIGGDVLGLVTTGMYDNPLLLYREYLQNAADAVAAQANVGGCVHVKIDPVRSQVTVQDNGTGLSPRVASRRLIDIGRSAKDRAVDRGFRGVGRLAALGFAERVQFLTRSCADEPVTEVTWSGHALRGTDLAAVDAATAIERCTSVSQLPEADWPDRFFEVRIQGVSRHAASALLNEDAVRSYIGEVGPVPMPRDFPLAAEIEEFLATYCDYFVLDVRINDDECPIERPFGTTIPLTGDYSAAFERLETRLIPQLDGDGPAAIVWLAHTPYRGSIPRRRGVRGLRARAGNMQIGTDRVFEHLFVESRFNGWCVGEVHIVDPRLIPNGRRDYFEPGPHLRNLENHIGAIAQEISSRCRLASSQRNKVRKISGQVHRLKCAHDLASSGYLGADDASALVARERQRLPEIWQTLSRLEATGRNYGHDDLARLEKQLDVVAAPSKLPLNGVPSVSVPLVQSAFGAIAEATSPDSAIRMIEAILRRLSKKETRTDHRLDDP